MNVLNKKSLIQNFQYKPLIQNFQYQSLIQNYNFIYNSRLQIQNNCITKYLFSIPPIRLLSEKKKKKN